MAYITQLKQQKSKKGAITLAAYRHNVNVLLSYSTFFIFYFFVIMYGTLMFYECTEFCFCPHFVIISAVTNY